MEGRPSAAHHKGGAAAFGRRPPFVDIIENAANNALNDAGHAVQNHVLTILAQFGHAQTM